MLKFSDRPGKNGPPSTWAQRIKIVVDVARGLNYLHFDRAVPQGNLKATNVLLDTAGYTIEQILDACVLGYHVPELTASKKTMPSFKSDVFVFGVMLFELLTGRCACDVITSEEGGVDLADWLRL
ncbi:receptor-like kinase [Medicago truncatula]|uniref:Receptor-like kinase n=1 Tax=Medicago truncatula TaxID=3880 RepID=A0A072V976_MEDTR|nr:receptor-like kinase [Medicago truncatula]